MTELTEKSCHVFINSTSAISKRSSFYLMLEIISTNYRNKLKILKLEADLKLYICHQILSFIYKNNILLVLLRAIMSDLLLYEITEDIGLG